jgi:hypothetical protein
MIDTNRNVKVIVAETKHDCKHLLGQFLDERHYDVLVEEDCDVYMPANTELATQTNDSNSQEASSDEKRIVFKFRKNYFTQEEQQMAYQGLREAATVTQNRGLASGPREESLGARHWVTDEQFELLEFMMDPKETLTGEDGIDEIRRRHREGKYEVPSRGYTWLQNKINTTGRVFSGAAKGFVFDEWVETVRKLPKQQMQDEAKRVATDLICNTTYANSVYSGIAGWFDRYPRIPYGRATTYTRDNPDKFAMAYPFLQSLARGFKELLPWRYANQMREAAKLDPEFLVPETPFTTITVNKTFRTAAHYDAGDLDSGLSNLLTLSNDGNYTGGYLIAPEYRVAVNVRPGDLLLINNHEVMHGNTPIECAEGSERVSLVVYFREKMLELGSKAYEDIRMNFVQDRKDNKEHPNQKPLWNGVTEGMWQSQEWKDYLIDKGGLEMAKKYEPDLMEEKSSLEEFF